MIITAKDKAKTVHGESSSSHLRDTLNKRKRLASTFSILRKWQNFGTFFSSSSISVNDLGMI